MAQTDDALSVKATRNLNEWHYCGYDGPYAGVEISSQVPK